MSYEITSRIDRLHTPGLVDMHFDLPMYLYEQRHRRGILTADFHEQFVAGDMGVIAAAIYLEDKYLPEQALRAGLGQVARLRAEVEADARYALCTNAAEIAAARARGQIAFILTMEGVEPLCGDIDMLPIFHSLGLRCLGLTHVRRNAAGEGGLIAPHGSSPQGLTDFGRAVIRGCETLGILLDLAHLNPAGIEDALALTSGPLVISHTNARRYHDIERNSSDDQMRAVAARGGVIGVNAVLVSPDKEHATLDRYIDHIEHIVALTSIDAIGLGFDFFEFIFDSLPVHEKIWIQNLGSLHFVPELTHHSHARNLTRRLIERGWNDASIEKLLWRNWYRIIGQGKF
ncbi:MAG: membrane dipeptidase [Chloroflexi bacterium]|nr:membrane dipeptidase [Chloroflexota bacterium]